MIYPVISEEAINKAWEELMTRVDKFAGKQRPPEGAQVNRANLVEVHESLSALELERARVQMALAAARLPVERREAEIQHQVSSTLSDEVDGKGQRKKAFTNEQAREAEVERRMQNDAIALPAAQQVALLLALDGRLGVAVTIHARHYSTLALLLRAEIADTYKATMLRRGDDPFPSPWDGSGHAKWARNENSEQAGEPEYAGESFGMMADDEREFYDETQAAILARDEAEQVAALQPPERE